MFRSLPTPRRFFAAALFAFVASSCRPAAALDEADRCLRDKMRASRVAVSSYLACDGRREDARRFSKCLARAARRTDRLLAVAEARAEQAGFRCQADGEALGIQGGAVWPLRFLDAAAKVGDECRAALAREMRDYASTYSQCIERSGLAWEEEIDDCASRARDEFTRAWNAAGPFCGAATTLYARTRIEQELGLSATRLEARCGDGVVGGYEDCDDGALVAGDGCSADCRRESCARVGGKVRCVACPADAEPNDGYDACRCPDGFSGTPGSCSDIDECANGTASCSEDRPCVNLEGSWACSIPCTEQAFHDALASCGAPSGAIAFQCSDTVIPLAGASDPALRDVSCNGLLIDGAGRNIGFELAPVCWQTPVAPEQCPSGLEAGGVCDCPDVDSGDAFLVLSGDRNVVRDLSVRGFFEGVSARGRGNVVEDLRFDRICDDAFGSVGEGLANTFRRIEARSGCDKCSENEGDLALTDADPRVKQHFHALLSDIDFEGCRTPVRVASSGRFLLEGLRMSGDGRDWPCDGPRFSGSGDAATTFVQLQGSVVQGCRRGVRFGRGSEGLLRDNSIFFNGLRGLHVSGGARVSVEGTSFEGNGGEGSQEPGFGGVAVTGGGAVDLGGGGLTIDGVFVESSGENSLCDNFAPGGERRDVDAAEPVEASGNWWCSDDPLADRILGPVTLDSVLGRAPLRTR